jgi:hypothetical protein
LHRFKITTGLCLLKNPPTFGPNPLLFKAKSPYLGGWKYGMYETRSGRNTADVKLISIIKPVLCDTFSFKWLTSSLGIFFLGLEKKPTILMGNGANIRLISDFN